MDSPFGRVLPSSRGRLCNDHSALGSFMKKDHLPLRAEGILALRGPEKSCQKSDNPMEGAWTSFINWASRTPRMVAEFNASTGRNFIGPDADIDPNGVDDDVDAFILWTTETYWKLAMAPEKVRAAIIGKVQAEARSRKPSFKAIDHVGSRTKDLARLRVR